MPELPEVETMVRGIRAAVEGRYIRELVLCPCDCRPLLIRPGFAELADRVRGLQIVSVRRRAKRGILELSNGEAIVIEPRMTGLLLLSDPPDPGHLRLEFQLAGDSPFNSLWFWDRRGLGTVTLNTAEEYQELLHGSRLGVDALEMTLENWQTVCAQSRRPIKVHLLDQTVVAGIGNLYASEILHRAQIHPETAADSISRSRLARLAMATLEILEDAIRYEGSTLGDGTYRNALNQSGGYQNVHRVYDREGETCMTCQSGVVSRIIQAQRSTFYCPRCQRKR